MEFICKTIEWCMLYVRKYNTKKYIIDRQIDGQIPRQIDTYIDTYIDRYIHRYIDRREIMQLQVST